MYILKRIPMKRYMLGLGSMQERWKAAQRQGIYKRRRTVGV